MYQEHKKLIVLNLPERFQLHDGFTAAALLRMDFIGHRYEWDKKKQTEVTWLSKQLYTSSEKNLLLMWTGKWTQQYHHLLPPLPHAPFLLFGANKGIWFVSCPSVSKQRCRRPSESTPYWKGKINFPEWFSSGSHVKWGVDMESVIFATKKIYLLEVIGLWFFFSFYCHFFFFFCSLTLIFKRSTSQLTWKSITLVGYFMSVS